jgi:DnaJ-class molecular chaperone
MSKPSHYDILQISKEANETEIKRAYRSLSLQWHPDRNPAPKAQAKFQEINEAYETLSDPSKKEMYDAELNGVFFRTSSMNESSDMADINNIINMMFGGGFGHPMMGNPMHGFGGPNIHVFQASGPGFSFGQGFGPTSGQGFGQTSGPTSGPGPEIFFQSHGGPPGFVPGTGFIPNPNFSQNLQKPPPIIKSVPITFQQSYSGCTIPIEIEKWSIYEGLKISENATIDLTIPPGVDDKEIIILRDCGNTSSNELKGDVKFIVSIENSPIFERSGMDLVFKKQLTLKESLCGFSFEIIHPNGKQLILNNMTNRTIIKPGFKKVISNMGMMREGNSGNLVIEFGVVYPDLLTLDQMTALEQVL